MTDSNSTAMQKPELPSSPPMAGRWVFGLQVVVLGVLIYLVFRNPIDGIIYRWGNDGNWSHGYLVPFFSLYFLSQHWNELPRIPRQANYWGLLLLLAGLTTRYYFYHKAFTYPQQFSIIIVLLGVVLFICGWKVFRIAWFPIAFLVCAVPLPHRHYFTLTLPLRRFASRLAGSLLDLLPDVDTEVQAVVINYSYKTNIGSLNIEEACSGMRLIMAFCTLGLAMAYLGERPLWQRVIMVACCLPIAVFCNMVRVCITGILTIHGHGEWAQGTAHQMLGLAMLPVALGLFAFIGYALKHLFVEVASDEEDDEER